MSYQAYQEVEYGYRCVVSGRGMDAVANLPKGRVRVWMLYQAYQRVEYGYRCRTNLTKRSGVGMDVYQAYQRDGYGTAACTHTRMRPQVFHEGRTR